MTQGTGRISLPQLTQLAVDGSVDTVVVVITDMQGRLQGKRIQAHHFLDEVVEHATEACSYLLAVDGPEGMSPSFAHFLAGLLAVTGDLTLFLAPNINSYKRFAEGSFAPTALAWGRDKRTCGFRVVGDGDSLRVECRVAGGDVNPYLAIAALVAAGLYGVEEELEPELVGTAYASDAPRLPGTLRHAAERFSGSPLAKSAFGHEVVEHYTNMARIELASFESAVTDWERYRCFERM